MQHPLPAPPPCITLWTPSTLLAHTLLPPYSPLHPLATHHSTLLPPAPFCPPSTLQPPCCTLCPRPLPHPMDLHTPQHPAAPPCTPARTHRWPRLTPPPPPRAQGLQQRVGTLQGALARAQGEKREAERVAQRLEKEHGALKSTLDKVRAPRGAPAWRGGGGKCSLGGRTGGRAQRAPQGQR